MNNIYYRDFIVYTQYCDNTIYRDKSLVTQAKTKEKNPNLHKVNSMKLAKQYILQQGSVSRVEHVLFWEWM